MARLSWINLRNGTAELGVNINKRVGNGGANLYRDVLLIQALFNYIGKDLLKLGRDYALPGVTGTMDGETYSAIGEFQIGHASRLLAKGFGWQIEPAFYAKRKLRLDGQKLMAITLLHVLASAAAKVKGDSSYTQALAKMHPDLNGFLDGGYGVTVGRVILEEEKVKVEIGRVILEPDVVVTIGRVILE